MTGLLHKYYLDQDINPLEAPNRPPVKNVYCLYGINEKTELSYQYRIVDEAFRLKKIIWEDNGGEVYSTTALLNRKDPLLTSTWGKSGDGTVTYNSLNWCQAWHTGDVELTDFPTVVDTSSRLQGLQHLLGIEKLIYGKYRYDSSSQEGNKTLHTSVIELERQNHRDIIRSASLIELLKEELDPRTDVEFIPFQEVEMFPARVEDLDRHSTEQVEQMIEILKKELEKRKSKHQADANEAQEQIDRGMEQREKDATSASIEDEIEGEELVAFVSSSGDVEEVRVLRGKNISGEEENLDDVRDDDEGSEFRTKEQGGIL